MFKRKVKSVCVFTSSYVYWIFHSCSLPTDANNCLSAFISDSENIFAKPSNFLTISRNGQFCTSCKKFHSIVYAVITIKHPGPSFGSHTQHPTGR